MLRLWPLTILLVFAALGCESYKATSSDLVGTWVLNDFSRERYLTAGLQKAAGKIVLNADGTFSVSEVPEDIVSSGPYSRMPPPWKIGKLVAGSGDWELTSRYGWTIVYLTFRSITRGQEQEKYDGGTEYVFRSGDPL